MTVLARVVEEAARRFGGERAIVVEGGETVTYAALQDRSSEVAGSLAAMGLGEGAVVAVDLPSGVEWVIAAAAVSRLGAVMAGVNPRAAPPERAAVLERLAPDLVLTELPPAGGGVLPALPPPDPDRVTNVVFTSGTTGEPKGATFAEHQIEAIRAIDLGAGAERWGGGLPMLASTQFCHIGISTKLAWYLRIGTRLHVLPRWRAADALRVVARERMATFGGVAAQVGLLLRVPDFDDHDLSCVRLLIVGAGPSPAALVEEAKRRFRAEYSVRYSSTEAGGVAVADGVARPGVEVRLVDGEVHLRSPAVMSGYWRDPERTAAALDADGWLRTGDLGELDGEGRLHLTGRAGDMYIRGGYNVHPAEVEAAIVAHPAVSEAAVVAIADEVMGEVGVAVVVPTDPERPPSIEDVRAFATDRVATYKLPEALVVVDELPLTTMDKVDRAALHYLVDDRLQR